MYNLEITTDCRSFSFDKIEAFLAYIFFTWNQGCVKCGTFRRSEDRGYIRTDIATTRPNRLQTQTLSNATQSIGKTHPFRKIAIPFEPIMQLWCPLKFWTSTYFLTLSIYSWKHHLPTFGRGGVVNIFSQRMSDLINILIIVGGVDRAAPGFVQVCKKILSVQIEQVLFYFFLPQLWSIKLEYAHTPPSPL